ncbi:MAG: ATP-dependent zinc metalloprotease FtsH [Clostridia bacterium]|nr:ATP-dependent zinc metalloprotease FtsH [Clostridia bacterium]
MKRKDLKVVLIYAILIIAIIFFLSRMFQSSQSEDIPTYDDIVRYFTAGEVAEFELGNDNILKLKLDNGEELAYEIANVSIFYSDMGEIIRDQMASGELKGEYEPPMEYPWWLSLIPYLIVIALVIGMCIFMMNAAGGKGGAGRMNSFGKARVKTPLPDDKNRVTFADVAGADEEKEELEEIVEFLKNPAKYSTLGAKIPHGVLLVGPPGTGKTLLAKAVAGEAGVPFFSISGSDFVEMYVVVGASRVRDLFETARKAPASIVFIDEIDAVGRHRGAGLGGGHDEREQTLNQLLVEMDGFGAHDGIIVIAATNRPDILDPALLRPGRFDRQITVNYPDIKGREEILRVHARNKPLEENADLNKVARTTAGFTGADLANLLNEAALLAARRGKSLIGNEDIEDAFLKVIMGPQKKSRVMKESEKRNTAYHEAGHALLAYYTEHGNPVHTISIIPAGRALGVTISIPTEDKFSVYRSELQERIAELLAGRVAEELTFGDYSGGASNDIERATDIARRMVTQLGMSEQLGPIRYGSGHGGDVFLGRDFSSTQDYSDETAALIDAEVKRIVGEAYALAKRVLTEHADKLKFVAEYLLAHEMMDGDQFKAAMETDEPTFEQMDAIAEEKARVSREANEQRARENLEAEKKKQAENDEQTFDEMYNEAIRNLRGEEPEDEVKDSGADDDNDPSNDEGAE